MSQANGNELPEGWAEVTLGDVVSVVRGVTYKKADARIEPGPGLVPMLRATNIGPSLSYEDCVYVPEALVKENQFLVPGDVVMATSSGSPRVVGKSARVDSGWRGTFGAFCAVIRPCEQVSSEFLALFLASTAFRERASQLAAGSNINNLKRDHIEKAPLPLPPKSEQERIVEAVSALNEQIDEGLAGLYRAEDSLKALEEATTELAVKEGTPSAIGHLLAGIEAGKSFRCEGRPAREGEWGVIKVSAMSWGEFLPDEQKAVLPGTEVDPRWEIRSGDLLFSRANTSALVGASVLVGPTRDQLLLSDKSLRLLPRPGIEPGWLQLALSARSTRAEISRVATGTKDSMRNISQAKLKAVSVRVPTKDVQEALNLEIRTKLREVQTAHNTIQVARREAEGLRSGIITAAMGGQLIRIGGGRNVLGSVRGNQGVSGEGPEIAKTAS